MDSITHGGGAGHPQLHQLANHALDVLLMLAEALGDVPQAQYSAQLASIEARASDLIYDVYQLTEAIAAIQEARRVA